ncbi:MAG: hypothetical protein UU48_C0001G0112 [Candidatus Uhrbacteria bacterium GW2011_GWF2_41_16]|uniref:Uncharacterized protein n=2 Tax=Candidatus Uhriibacteriota TaxID=1752732 RepID=A0A0G0YEK5_9BACT|nr:MAG: hypothetical protein UU31_C0002G0075 [Candidatus Uhrbacteria bacterium GW2011_GWA2_41_10]KKR87818.1 MAG: hypothetical protein UU35_C0001G0099 [Candidatus Uhrbacteria bacterium GW2011_GWC2_41_11]KKR98757.1 MAG: hypothetical protein UU48_C0001G0112 [Candidatus Uhrbacteria bacterium GW2011_GWF2_41_16]HBP00125.1 hypothetical protein [Candidatus Uhrbacteria bacterium]
MRDIEDLKVRSRLALTHEELLQIAGTMSPNGAFEKAQSLNYSDEEARSCRFLAIIRRDHGKDVFDDTIRSLKDDELDIYLKDAVLPRIKLLEAIAGAPLRIVRPKDRGLTLGDYLSQTKPAGINLGMTLGDELLISMQWGIRKDTSQQASYELSTADGTILVKETWTRFGGVDKKRTDDRQYLCRLVFDFVSESIGTQEIDVSSTDTPTISGTLIQFLEKKGEVFPSPLWKTDEIFTYIRRGEVEKTRQVIAELREKAAADGIKLEFLVCLDIEAQGLIKDAQRIQRYKDADVPLIEKVRDETVLGAFGVTVIPGPKAKKSYNFFIYSESSLFKDWVKALKIHGYGGSVLYASDNYPSGFAIVGTRQVHGIFLDDNIGSSSKDWWVDNVQIFLDRSGIEPLSQYTWDDWYDEEFVEQFGEFLKKNFPLV